MNDKPAATLTGRLVGVGRFILVCLALNYFFVSIKLLGAFKSLGSGVGEQLIVQLADNPVIGLLIGVLVTSVAQSSSATTSLVVGLVASGSLGSDPALALARAIPIIMGANVGTTITNTIVSIAHIGSKKEFERAFSCATVHDFFNVLAIIIFLPLELLTGFLSSSARMLAELFADAGGGKFNSPIKTLVNPQKDFFVDHFQSMDWITLLIIFTVAVGFFYAIMVLFKRIHEEKSIFSTIVAFSLGFALIGTAIYRYAAVVFRPETAIFIFGLGMLFCSLTIFVKVMRTAVFSRWTSLFDAVIFKTAPRAMVFGVLMTALVQSSSVSTSIVIPLAGAGILTIRQVFPYTLGANVGTTITAMLAALATGETVAVSVAFAHLLFNIFGITLLYPLKMIPIGCATGMAHLTLRNKAIPVIYIVVVFFAIPLLLIWLTS